MDMIKILLDIIESLIIIGFVHNCEKTNSEFWR